MSDEAITERLIEYLGRYATFGLPTRNIAAAGPRLPARKTWAAPGSAARAIGGTALALALVTALVVVLGVGFGLRARTQTAQPRGATLFSGPSARGVANPRNTFVWFTGPNSLPVVPNPASEGGLEPAPGSQPGVAATGLRVVVLDWTGAVRYRITIAPSKLDPGVIPAIETISSDGTRALLNDGVVIDQTGAVVGAIPGLKNFSGTPRWTSDGAGVCAATDVAGRLSLAVYGPGGTRRAIASVTDTVADAVGGFFASSVLSCDPRSNIAVVARYRYIPADAEQCAPPAASCVESGVDTVDAALWGIRMSDGAVLIHQADKTVAVGEPFWYGSENGALAAEFVTRGVAVVDIPSGGEMLKPADLGSANLPAVSADGTRILWTVENASRTQLTMDLVGGADGATIRSVTIDGKNLPPVTAIAYPDGSSFMVDVAGDLLLLDSSGGISRLSTTINLSVAPGSLKYEGMSQAQR
jgi:hypothetical protein